MGVVLVAALQISEFLAQAPLVRCDFAFDIPQAFVEIHESIFQRPERGSWAVIHTAPESVFFR